jgi:hypothetical protein
MTFVSTLYIRATHADEVSGSANQRVHVDRCLQSLLKLFTTNNNNNNSVDESISQLDILIGKTTTTTIATSHNSVSSSLSMLVKCALMRGLISVFDDDMLSPYLLQPPIFPVLTEWCTEPLPEMRQYVLQTMGTLLDRLNTLLSNMAHCGSLLRLSPDVESRLRLIASLLVQSWTHPSRQVSHTFYHYFVRAFDI